MTEFIPQWNVNPTEPITIARLISELEGSSYILHCYGENDDYLTIQDMLKRYYKLYFKLVKEKDEEKRKEVIKAFI
tara:strand:- start:745 stop:972 length:228 start_codon:yes stop_codon:yes gene_type:complete